MVKANETPSSIYLMHKYWGKKPSKELKEQIIKYTKKGDLIFDPFAGYGGIGIEALIENRNVILNDLNPMANFISECILNQNIDFNLLNKYYDEIKEKVITKEKEWYSYKEYKIVTILRNKKDEPTKIKILKNKKMEEISLSVDEIKDRIKKEKNVKIKSWFPTNKLIQNSRISSSGNLYVNDLFPISALDCQSFLLECINQIPNSIEKDVLLLAFTSNLANCSKLVPPIISRGEMSQGAWMTGFYIGETYLENNVFHYYDNRVKKIIKGKKDLNSIISKTNYSYKITNEDAKKLTIKDETIDFVFTDFPYGDTVPYFEQSQIWNLWLKKEVDYENEIVVSDSKERKKNSKQFANDIEKSINEISRVLKVGKYFTFTFHSLNGEEWEAISNSIANNPFEFVELKFLEQKTFTPRQLNRKRSIKGDVVVTFKKVKNKQLILDYNNINEKIKNEITNKIKKGILYDTNDLIILCVSCLLKYNQQSDKIDFIELINQYFSLDDNSNKWILKE